MVWLLLSSIGPAATAVPRRKARGPPAEKPEFQPESNIRFGAES